MEAICTICECMQPDGCVFGRQPKIEFRDVSEYVTEYVTEAYVSCDRFCSSNKDAEEELKQMVNDQIKRIADKYQAAKYNYKDVLEERLDELNRRLNIRKEVEEQLG